MQLEKSPYDHYSVWRLKPNNTYIIMCLEGFQRLLIMQTSRNEITLDISQNTKKINSSDLLAAKQVICLLRRKSLGRYLILM